MECRQERTALGSHHTTMGWHSHRQRPRLESPEGGATTAYQPHIHIHIEVERRLPSGQNRSQTLTCSGVMWMVMNPPPSMPFIE